MRIVQSWWVKCGNGGEIRLQKLGKWYGGSRSMGMLVLRKCGLPSVANGELELVLNASSGRYIVCYATHQT